MGQYTRSIKKSGRKAFAKGLARGVFKSVGSKLRMPKNLRHGGGRPSRGRAPSPRPNRLRPYAGNYRRNFRNAHPEMPKKWQVHHAYPQKYESIMKRAGVNIHENHLLRGVDPKVHSRITTEWARWERRLGRRPTPEEIVQFAKQIDRKYGKHFIFG